MYVVYCIQQRGNLGNTRIKHPLCWRCSLLVHLNKHTVPCFDGTHTYFCCLEVEPKAFLRIDLGLPHLHQKLVDTNTTAHLFRQFIN